MRPVSCLHAAAAASFLLCLSLPATAKPARCFTSDDGTYPCDFRLTDPDGSFQISAKGKPTFMLNMDGPGRAFGYANFGGGRNVSLPGEYTRDTADKACWVNGDTGTKICAW